MGLRTYLGNALIARGRKLARSSGAELCVDLSEHSIELTMVDPNQDKMAWDPNLYKNGNVFLNGYANPIKPTVNYNEDLEEPDTVDVEDGDVDADATDDAHVSLISSPRYRDYMRQDLISQLLNPKEQWQLIAYGIIALGALQFITIIVMLYATGSF